MAKRGMDVDNLTPFLRDCLDREDWSLCVGAGTSYPLLPSWYQLVEDLFNVISPKTKPEDINRLEAIYSPDILLQLLFNMSKKNLDDFSRIMSTAMFANIKSVLDKKEWEIFQRSLYNFMYSRGSSTTWDIFANLIETKFDKSSAYYIGKVVAKIINTELRPKAILSFNAEPFLLSQINIHLRNRASKEKDFRPKRYVDVVTSSVSDKTKDRIHYIFCHGLLLPPEIPAKGLKRHCMNDKLVFLENEYQNLTNLNYSWHASTFFEVANSTRIIFIGVSFSDSNMRRWLSQVQMVRSNDIYSLSKKMAAYSSRHYWIRKKPASRPIIPLIEEAVSHLGVRLIWINEWNEAGLALEKILGLKKT